jgi:hypothetical protein
MEKINFSPEFEQKMEAFIGQLKGRGRRQV